MAKRGKQFGLLLLAVGVTSTILFLYNTESGSTNPVASDFGVLVHLRESSMRHTTQIFLKRNGEFEVYDGLAQPVFVSRGNVGESVVSELTSKFIDASFFDLPRESSCGLTPDADILSLVVALNGSQTEIRRLRNCADDEADVSLADSVLHAVGLESPSNQRLHQTGGR